MIIIQRISNRPVLTEIRRNSVSWMCTQVIFSRKNKFRKKISFSIENQRSVAKWLLHRSRSAAENSSKINETLRQGGLK